MGLPLKVAQDWPRVCRCVKAGAPGLQGQRKKSLMDDLKVQCLELG